MADINKNLLYVVERYCNNFFNDRNDPDDPTRNYPDAFLDIVEKIQEYIKNQKFTVDPSAPGMIVASMTDAGSTVQFTPDSRLNGSWTQTFAPYLSVFKRVKTL